MCHVELFEFHIVEENRIWDGRVEAIVDAQRQKVGKQSKRIRIEVGQGVVGEDTVKNKNEIECVNNKACIYYADEYI